MGQTGMRRRLDHTSNSLEEREEKQKLYIANTFMNIINFYMEPLLAIILWDSV